MLKNIKKKQLRILIFTWVFFLLFSISATVIALLFALNELRGLKPFVRGFFCDDQNLMYPYREDSVSTLMAIVVLMVPTVVIVKLP